MDKVKIQRVKKNKKRITSSEKILAGIGLGTTLLGGAAIAQKSYGNGAKRRKILEANASVVKNSKALRVGATLVISS